MELTGSLLKKLPVQSGVSSRGEWQKQEFIVEYQDGNFPKKVCLNVWGDKVPDLESFNEGDKLKIFFNIESREYNQRWYTDLRAWRIDRDETASFPDPASNETAQGFPEPSQGFPEPNQESTANPEDYQSDTVDDLPF
jgi:hypothetical protein